MEVVMILNQKIGQENLGNKIKYAIVSGNDRNQIKTVFCLWDNLFIFSLWLCGRAFRYSKDSLFERGKRMEKTLCEELYQQNWLYVNL